MRNERVDEGADVDLELRKNRLSGSRERVATQGGGFDALLFAARDVMNIEMEGLRSGVRAKQGRKLPVVLSPEETRKVFAAIEMDTHKLILRLIYGAGLSVTELFRLRTKDIDFDNELLFVRSGKGDKDRSTLLPKELIPRLKKHLENVREMHSMELKAGCAEVHLPNALARKYKNAASQFGWYWAFPSQKTSLDTLDRESISALRSSSPRDRKVHGVLSSA